MLSTSLREMCVLKCDELARGSSTIKHFLLHTVIAPSRNCSASRGQITSPVHVKKIRMACSFFLQVISSAVLIFNSLIGLERIRLFYLDINRKLVIKFMQQM